MNQKKNLVASIVLGLTLTLGTGGAAFAYKDSGVSSHACGSQYGLLKVHQKGSGNSWAPGDWSGYPEWHGTSSYYRWVNDYQDVGYGGGYWRVATNGNYDSLVSTCSPFA